jgi:2-oxoglutarate ferredoxin oxidoreductase subunit beta
VELAGEPLSDVPVWDETAEDPTAAFLVSRIGDREGFPLPIGIFRRVEAPTFEGSLHAQIEEETRRRGAGRLEALLGAGESWRVGGTASGSLEISV